MTEKDTRNIEEITELPGSKKAMPGTGSTNKIVYLIVIEDLLLKTKPRSFVAAKYDAGINFLTFRGAEISNTQIDKLSTYEDAIELANKNKSPIVELILPWHRVRGIANVTYRHKGI